MKRILPIILVVGAILLHFCYCEWEIREGVKTPSASESDRLIFYHHSHIRNVTLYARPSEDKQVATIYGVLLPVLLLVGAGVMGHFQQTPKAEGAQFTSW